MKNIGLTIVTIGVTMLCTSCGALVEFVDYGINEWEKIAPADSYDRTHIDAWQSGTGGKVLVASGVVASLFGNSSNEAVQTAKNVINNAISDLNSNDEFKKNDVNNFFGAILTMGDAMIGQHRTNQINAYLQNPEIAMMIDSVDYSTGRIYWKSQDKYINDVMEAREQELANSFEERSIDMTPEEYYSLSQDRRQEVDVLLLQDVQIQIENPQTTSQPTSKINEIQETASSYIEKVESSLVGNYKFNETTLMEVQKNELDNIVEYLTSNKNISIEVIGHTCSIGSEKGNYNVGLQRAINAKNYLINKGIDASRINVISEGYNNPKASNDTPEGRAQNRRVTFNVIK